MAETTTQCLTEPTGTKLPGRGATLSIPSAAMAVPSHAVNRLKSKLASPSSSPVNQNGSFEFDRVIKSGYVLKRSRKTKVRSSLLFWSKSALS